MTTRAQLRKAAGSLPEVEELSQHGTLEFAVRGRAFVSLSGDGLVQLSLSDELAEQVLPRFAVAEPLTRGGKRTGIQLPLAGVTGMQLNSLVEKAWLSRAPKRLADARRAALGGEGPSGEHSLPKSIGKPATRALLAAGVTSLDDVASRTEAELSALHGVGPRAIGLLGAALAARGLAFHDGGGRNRG